MANNLLLSAFLGNAAKRTDSYKVGHWSLYDMDRCYSYFESRSWGSFPGRTDYGGLWGPKIAFFGLQYILMTYYCEQAVTEDDVEQADEFYGRHFPYKDRKVFNRKGWMDLVRKRGGRMPVSIRAVPEGMCLPPGHVLMTVENTDPEFAWVTNFLETHLAQTWYPCTVCTQSREMFKVVLAALYISGTPAEAFGKLHDFGGRGVSCMEQGCIGDAAHLAAGFIGTDTVVGPAMVKEVYGDPMAGISIFATEHSTMSQDGPEGELGIMSKVLDLNPTGLAACVSDTFDIYDAIGNKWGKTLRDRVMNRDGCMVFRPDSSGRTRPGGYESMTQVLLTVSDLILAQFGGEVNAKGYNVFDSHVRAIQGDGINFTSYVALIRALLQKKWSMDNFAFGSGGGLLQSMDRDVLDFAFKASAKQKDGEWYDVWKDPYHQGKQSKRGRLKLVRIGGTHGGAYRTVRQDDAKYAALPDLLVQVYQDGEMLVQHNFAEIRRRTLPHPNEVQAVAEAFELGTITDWGDYAGTSAYKG